MNKEYFLRMINTQYKNVQLKTFVNTALGGVGMFDATKKGRRKTQNFVVTSLNYSDKLNEWFCRDTNVLNSLTNVGRNLAKIEHDFLFRTNYVFSWHLANHGLVRYTWIKDLNNAMDKYIAEDCWGNEIIVSEPFHADPLASMEAWQNNDSLLHKLIASNAYLQKECER